MTDIVRAECWDSETKQFTKKETLLSALGFSDWKEMPRVVSFVGAGGKTSTMYDLAREVASKGARVLITTSTHILKPQMFETAVVEKLADLREKETGRPVRRAGLENAEKKRAEKIETGKTEKNEKTEWKEMTGCAQRTNAGQILVAGKQAQGPGMEEKLTMPDDLGKETVMENLSDCFDVILIEADGSKRLPLKVPSGTEPVLIPQTGLVVACAGLKAGGKRFGDICFRFASHGSWLKRKEHDRVTAEDIALILMDERGSRKGVDGRYYRIVLNQADTMAEKQLSESIVRILPEKLQKVCIRTTRAALEEKRKMNIKTNTEMDIKTNTETNTETDTGVNANLEIAAGQMKTAGMGRVLIKGSGDLASGIALRLYRAGFQILMTEIAVPTTVRRTVAFSPAVYLGRMQVEDVIGVLCDSVQMAEKEIQNGNIAVMVDEHADCIWEFQPDVLVDAILAKRNLGTRMTDAPLVIGVGPGFTAGENCHCVVETKRGHYLGRCIWSGSAIPNTGIPGLIGGYGLERLIKAPADGTFRGCVEIGAEVKAGDIVGYVNETPVKVQIDGVVRGLLQDGVEVTTGLKSGDVDPRCEVKHCFTVSDKASSIGGGVLEAILNHRYQPHAHVPVAMVLLAAGDSKRFGSDNKLLAIVGDKPMYRHVADEVNAIAPDCFAKKIIVSQYDEILNDLGQDGFETVKNDESMLGISHSIHLALGQIPEHYAVCFSVCDQPWLTGDTIKGLVSCFRKNRKGIACVTWNEKEGNPVLFASEYRKELLALLGDVGGKKVLLAHPEDVVCYPAKNSRELADVDEKSQLCYNQND